MLVCQLKSKIHRAMVTRGDVEYEGSIEIPQDLVEAAGLWPGEKVLVASVTSGNRFETYVLVGPPGTGKTSVALRSMVEEFHATPTNQILLLSYTNRAVDEICEMLESITPALPYLRIGGELSCEERFRPHLLRNVMQPCNKRQEVLQSLNGIRIVVGTVSSISGHPELFDLKQFDVAIIDEASQILEPQILSILCAHQGDTCAVKKFVLIGDHKQLPAVVLQRTEESQVTSEALHTIGLTDCRNSLFERLYSLQSANGSTHAMLHRQGRMHPAISAFASIGRISFFSRTYSISSVVSSQAEDAPTSWQVTTTSLI